MAIHILAPEKFHVHTLKCYGAALPLITQTPSSLTRLKVAVYGQQCAVQHQHGLHGLLTFEGNRTELKKHVVVKT